MQATLCPHQAPRPPAKPRWVVSARKMLSRCVGSQRRVARQVSRIVCVQLAWWDECGKIDGSCCPVNTKCTVVNQWYSQCQPYQQPEVYGSGCSGRNEVGSRASVARRAGRRVRSTTCCAWHIPSCRSAAQLRMWDQCGGRNSPAGLNNTDSNSCCPVGAACTYVNEWQVACCSCSNRQSLRR